VSEKTKPAPKVPLARTSVPLRRRAAKPDAGGAKLAQRPQSDADVALIWGKSQDGSLNILRKRADRFEAGTVVPLKEGRPIQGEVIQLHPREGSPLCDVEVHLPAPVMATPAASAGPPQVATDAYRKNWDSIYKRSIDRKLLN
jgi:hypothetical protein